MGLQVVYFGLALYGWYEWLYGGKGRTALKVSRTPSHHWTVLAVIAVVVWASLGKLTSQLPGVSLPYVDAATTTTSLVAQWMMTRKLIENWTLWIAVDAELVPEFVRAFAEQKQGLIDFSDHGPIALGQMALEDEHMSRATRLVVQDTDLLSTVVHCHHYFGRCPAWIEDRARARRPDLYLLCQPDIPWVADGVRDREHLREAMQEIFQRAVAASGAPSVDLRGSREERLARAIGAIDGLSA